MGFLINMSAALLLNLSIYYFTISSQAERASGIWLLELHEIKVVNRLYLMSANYRQQILYQYMRVCARPLKIYNRHVHYCSLTLYIARSKDRLIILAYYQKVTCLVSVHIVDLW